jgi:hypothetical protein
LADKALAVFGESDDGRSGPRAFAVFEHDRLPAFHSGHAGIGRAEVDSEDFAHKVWEKLKLEQSFKHVACQGGSD